MVKTYDISNKIPKNLFAFYSKYVDLPLPISTFEHEKIWGIREHHCSNSNFLVFLSLIKPLCPPAKNTEIMSRKGFR